MLDKQHYANLAMDTWLGNLQSTTQPGALIAFQQFKDELHVDPVEMMFESRRTQETRFVEEALERFHTRLVLRGLSDGSAKTYCNLLRNFFVVNRIPIKKRRNLSYIAEASLHGDGLCVRIPREVCNHYRLGSGDQVRVIILQPENSTDSKKQNE